MHHTHNIVNVNDLCCQIMSQHGSHILILPDKIVNALACSTPKEFTRVLNPSFFCLNLLSVCTGRVEVSSGSC